MIMLGALLPYAGTLVEIVVAILILVPGFIAFQIFKSIYVLEREYSDLETIIWSVFASYVIYIPFGLLTGLESIDKLTLSFLSIQNLALLMTVATVPAVAVASALKRIFKRDVVKGDLWDFLMDKIAATQDPIYALIHTKTNKEFYGQVARFGMSPSQRDLIIKEPELLIRDTNLKVTRKKWGKEIYLHPDEIRQIVLMSEVT